MDLEDELSFDVIMLREGIRYGQRISAFTIEAWKDGNWKKLYTGTTIGHKRLIRIDPVQTSRLRISIDGSKGSPILSGFGLFDSSAAGNESGK